MATKKTLNENQFSDLTFEIISAGYVNRIHSKAFGKTAQTLVSYWCVACLIENSPPNYDLWKAVGQLTKLTELYMSVNVSEIPENVITTFDQSESQMKYLWFDNSKQKMTVKSGAFQNLHQIELIGIGAKFNKFEKGAFKLNKKSDKQLKINFYLEKNFTSDVFENGTFDGIQRPVQVCFTGNLNYLPEGSFKSILDQNKQNRIKFDDGVYKTTIDCFDCRNYWLIRDGKKYQLINPHCSFNSSKFLFDDDVVTKFKAKCAKLY